MAARADMGEEVQSPSSHSYVQGIEGETPTGGLIVSATPSKKRLANDMAGEEDEGDFILARGRHKRVDLNITPKEGGGDRRTGNETNRVNVNTVYIKGVNINITKKNPTTVRSEIIKKFGQIEKIEVAKESLRVTCLSSEQKEEILQCISLTGESVECSKPRSSVNITQSVRQNKQIIFNVPVEID